MQTKNEILVYLVGKPTKIKDFMQDISPLDDRTMSFCHDFRLNGNLFSLCGFDIDFPPKLERVHAIIYFEPEEIQQDICEMYRQETSCIALDFDTIDLKPRKCLDKINELTQQIPQSDRNEKVIRSIMVMQGNLDKNSIFSVLPNELATQISLYQFKLKRNHPIFGNSTKPNHTPLPSNDIRTSFDFFSKKNSIDKSKSSKEEYNQDWCCFDIRILYFIPILGWAILAIYYLCSSRDDANEQDNANLLVNL